MNTNQRKIKEENKLVTFQMYGNSEEIKFPCLCVPLAMEGEDDSKKVIWRQQWEKAFMSDCLIRGAAEYFKIISITSLITGNSAGVWVSAGEKFWEKLRHDGRHKIYGIDYLCKVRGQNGIGRFYSANNLIFFDYRIIFGFGTLINDQFEDLEILDQSPSSIKDEKGWEDVFLKYAGSTEYDFMEPYLEFFEHLKRRYSPPKSLK